MNPDPPPAIVPARRHVETDPCGPGECPCELAGYPCPAISGIHRHPVVGACAKQKADAAFRASLVEMARGDHEDGPAVIPARAARAGLTVDGLPVCPHRTFAGKCGEEWWNCALGKGQEGVVSRSDCATCPEPAKVANARTIDEHTFITTEQLTRDTLEFIKELPADIDLVVAISRSGLLPGSIVSYQRHLPLLTVSRFSGVVDPGHGTRMEIYDKEKARNPSHVLLIDDTAASGHEMMACFPIVKAHFPGARITRAVIYTRPGAVGALDMWFATYPGLHFLEHNFCNAGHGAMALFDHDGVISRDFTAAECADDATYRKAMATLDPLYLPRRLPVPMIVTARPESTRDITLEWLARWGVKVDRLVMRDFEIDPAKGWTRHIAEYKAYHYAGSIHRLFIESEPDQAKIINELARKPVLCPAAKRVFP